MKNTVYATAILLAFTSHAAAWERGDSAVLCGELSGFLWMGKEHHPCYVTILEIAGSKARIVTNNYCVGGQYHKSIGSEGSTAWVNKYALERYSSDCRASK